MFSLPITNPTWIFFVVLLIILFAPIVMGKLRIPHIIGLVLSGVLVGEYGLNLLARDDSFELFGKVGLYYIMFLASLEMDMEGLRKNGMKVAFYALMSFAIPFAITFLAGVGLMGYSMSAALILASILSSNTIVAYPIIAKYGLQQHRAVTLCVGSTMLSLLSSLIVLAVVVGSFEGTNDVTFWLLFVLKFAAFCIGGAIVIPRLARKFLRRYSDAVMHYVFVLCVLFACAALSEMIGLEGVFGAFFAGLVLNRYIPHVSSLMNRIEFTGNALFIPYFLIGVGMLIDVRVLFDGGHTLWIVFCMVFFGTLGKCLASYIMQRLMQKPLAWGHLMAGLTSAHAAGAIAITLVGMRLLLPDGTPLVDADMLNGVVMMILFTCIIASMLTEHGARSIVLSQHKEPQFEDKSDDEKILIPVRYEERANQLVKLAIYMRNRKLNRGLIGLNLVYDDADAQQNQEAGRRLLEQVAKTAAAADVRMQTQSRIAVNIANGIKHAFMEYDASEIIIGMHKKTEHDGSFWGNFLQSLYNGLNRQIMIVRMGELPVQSIRRIHVAVPQKAEFEPGFYRWVERLCRLARSLDSRIVFHAPQEALNLIEPYLKYRHSSVRATYDVMERWERLTQLSQDVKPDHLMVIVTARHGTVSHQGLMDRLPEVVSRNYPHCALMLLFPDQYGNAPDQMTFTSAQHTEQRNIYAPIIKWLRKRI